MTHTPEQVAEIARGQSAMTLDMLLAPGLRGSVASRFWRNVAIAEEGECWTWTGGVGSRGYGRIQTPVSSSSTAHSVSYVLHHGEIEADMVIDHTCRNRLCVNPRHLRQVSRRQNSIENSIAPVAINHAKTHCVNGHELAGRNLIERRGWRQCRLCQNHHNREYYARKRAAHLLSDTPHD